VFSFQKFCYPIVSDKFNIFDPAHAVPRPVPEIQAPQPVRGKLRAITAEPSVAFVANPQPAVHAGLGPVLPGVVAAMAGVVLVQKGFANHAVHPARGNQILFDPARHFGPFSIVYRPLERFFEKSRLWLFQ
jgi:hypothetical protein